MNDFSLKVYHRLPYFLQSYAAGIRGSYLRRWRYGKETEALVEAALEREQWSAERWKNWQEEQLSVVLHRAVTRVPYYRALWDQRKKRGDRKSYKYLENWPILNKETLRRNLRVFIPDDQNIKNMAIVHTSGTTGKPLALWRSKETVRHWYAIFEARTRRWHDVHYKQNWAILGGQPILNAKQNKPPFWIWNTALNQLYLSANHLTRNNIKDYLDALSRYRITHLFAYSSAATFIANEIINNKIEFDRLKLVVTNAEPCYPWQKILIQKGLAHNVKQVYGMGELVAAASECEHNSMHLWPEIGWIESIQDVENGPNSDQIVTKLVCTSLFNLDMPLIRYDVGDRGHIESHQQPCACNRTLPTISDVDGRMNDYLQAPDGKRIYWTNHIFYGLPVCEAQIVQESVKDICILIVPAKGYNSDISESIKNRVRSIIDSVNVVLKLVDFIPRGPNGKFKGVISRL